ncbi:MAG: hypothetical protein R2737_11650 [Candidatus Nanopelagicales bacterium]
MTQTVATPLAARAAEAVRPVPPPQPVAGLGFADGSEVLLGADDPRVDRMREVAGRLALGAMATAVLDRPVTATAAASYGGAAVAETAERAPVPVPAPRGWWRRLWDRLTGRSSDATR